MTKAFNTDLQRRLESFIAEAGSQEKAASLIGYSAATLSTYRKGTYNGDGMNWENESGRKICGGLPQQCDLYYGESLFYKPQFFFKAAL